ncbi:two-component system sensor histidine kinase NtrB [Hydrogenophaga sp. BPS33]|uniref:two-component system sensor histidine kinase NtrB n=1 Tax=Hydrogenophaga sp. BPS33 TaxID=2651974 RepID=UPI001320340F|nr:PAS domain S-box protein [Hydrogenophaga sp. BPS33]QHE88603.1 PAS domain S-box protein [Hydrogenophaga sp. BPS33]
MEETPVRSAWRQRLRSSRWRLWAALILLVVVMLSVLVFLATQYEETRDQIELEQDAETIANEIGSNLLHNVQTLQSLHSVAPSVSDWGVLAADFLTQRREAMRLEWRDTELRLVAHRDSLYVPDLMGVFTREQAMHEVRGACDAAQRQSSPAYSSSYFWPMSNGRGVEMIEMCLPIANEGRPAGFLVATYSLPGMLAELTSRSTVRGRGLGFSDADGTRLAMLSTLHGTRRNLTARAVLDLPGYTLMLQLQSQRQARGLFPNVLTAMVSALSLALLSVLYLLGRDIRRRQRAELEVARALAFRKAMEDSLVTGLRARDMDGRITYVNPAFCEMVGLSAEQLVGTGPPAPWWPPELVDEYQQRQEVRLANQVLPREGHESVFRRPDGTRFPVLIIEAPLIDAQGQQTGFMGAIIDLTEQRRVEELNRASRERLQATARLTTVGEMATLLSHELNQPLAAIASYASGTLNLLESSVSNPLHADLAQAMRRIAEQAERAGRVIKSVGDFVRRRERVRETVTPQSLIDAIQPLLGLLVNKQNIRLQIHIEPECPQVQCDRTMIEQVLLNLSRNGVQAMPQGDPPTHSGLRLLRIEVGRLRPHAGGTSYEHIRKSWVSFAITDHGHGMSDEVVDKLFTPFFTTRPEGMGIGLSLCRTVIEQHGGALTHEPARPRGTVFRFTLPAAP